MTLPGLAPLCIPINKTGRQSRDFPRMVEAGFASGHHMVVFPAGLCSRKIDGRIQDLPWTKTFITKSVQTKRDVVPMYFSGRNSERFYRIANICKALRLRFNLAMLFLPDEMFRNRGNTFELHGQTHTVADIRQQPHTGAMGAVGEAGSISAWRRKPIEQPYFYKS